jgi:hypothetical protein
MIEANGVELCTEPFGHTVDPPILLIMVVGGSMLWWDEGFCRMLAEEARFVIRYDHRDTGRSVTYEPGQPAYTGADLVADIAGVSLGRRLSSAHSPYDDLTVIPFNVVGEQLTKMLKERSLLGPIGVLEVGFLVGVCGRRDVLVASLVEAVRPSSHKSIGRIGIELLEQFDVLLFHTGLHSVAKNGSVHVVDLQQSSGGTQPICGASSKSAEMVTHAVTAVLVTDVDIRRPSLRFLVRDEEAGAGDGDHCRGGAGVERGSFLVGEPAVALLCVHDPGWHARVAESCRGWGVGVAEVLQVGPKDLAHHPRVVLAEVNEKVGLAEDDQNMASLRFRDGSDDRCVL